MTNKILGRGHTNDTSPARTHNLTMDNGTANVDVELSNLLKNYVASPAQGQVLYYDGSNWVALSPGTSGQFLKTLGAGANPEWGAAAGKLVQRVEATPNTTYSSITTAMPFDDTIPQNTEGGEVITVTITPSNASNRLVARASFTGTSNTSPSTTIALFQDATAGALAVANLYGAADGLVTIHLVHEMAAGTTSATTFKLRAGNNAGATTYINGRSGGRLFGGVASCRLSVEEIQV